MLSHRKVLQKTRLCQEKPLPIIQLEVSDCKIIDCLVDNASCVTLIKEYLANRLIRLNKTKFYSVQKRLKSNSDKDMVVSGKVCLNFKLGNRMVKRNALVCSDRSAFPGGILLGRDLFIGTNSSIVTKCRGIQYVEFEGYRYNYKKTGTAQSICLVKGTDPFLEGYFLFMDRSW